jgi:hypothetical protein
VDRHEQPLTLPETDDYTFSDWIDSTRRLQEVAYGSYYEDFTDEQRADSMMMNLFAIVAETVELGQEVGWKPWSQPRGWVNREQGVREIVDIMHFAGNMLVHLKATGAELTAAYKAKQLENLQRQMAGYDTRDKCPNCHRDTSTFRTGSNGDTFCLCGALITMAPLNP